MRKTILTSTVAVAALMLGAQAANATVFSVQRDVEHAVSFNDQESLSDQTSHSGADLSVLFRFDADTGALNDGTTGVFSAEVENISAPATNAIMTAIGIKVRNLFTLDSFSFTPLGIPDCDTSPASCAFSSPSSGQLSGFLSYDFSADADPAPPVNGLDIGDKALFEWNVSFAAGALDGLTDFEDFYAPELIDNTLLYTGDPGTDVRAFWVAHMQSIDNFDISDPNCVPGQCDGSLKIGGALNTRVPEPGTLAIFGIGLLGLGMLARRRRFIA